MRDWPLHYPSLQLSEYLTDCCSVRMAEQRIMYFQGGKCLMPLPWISHSGEHSNIHRGRISCRKGEHFCRRGSTPKHFGATRQYCSPLVLSPDPPGLPNAVTDRCSVPPNYLNAHANTFDTTKICICSIKNWWNPYILYFIEFFCK